MLDPKWPPLWIELAPSTINKEERPAVNTASAIMEDQRITITSTYMKRMMKTQLRTLYLQHRYVNEKHASPTAIAVFAPLENYERNKIPITQL